MPESHLRAADADRAAVATVLGQHMSAGRLTMDEYDERLARAYAARTHGELDQLTADLPAVLPAPRTAPSPTRQTGCSAAAIAAHGGPGSNPHSFRSWLTTSLIVLIVWAATSLATWEFLYFWPVWVIGPWGAVLLAQRVTHRDGDREDRRRLI